MKIEIILGIVVVLCFAFLFYASIDQAFLELEKKEACKEIGMKSNTQYMKIPSCEDKQGNIHFVKFDCTMLKMGWNKCSANKIKVGEVWGTS